MTYLIRRRLTCRWLHNITSRSQSELKIIFANYSMLSQNTLWKPVPCWHSPNINSTWARKAAERELSCTKSRSGSSRLNSTKDPFSLSGEARVYTIWSAKIVESTRWTWMRWIHCLFKISSQSAFRPVDSSNPPQNFLMANKSLR